MEKYIEQSDQWLSYEELQSLRIEGDKCNLRAIAPSDALSIYWNANNPAIYKKWLTWHKDEYTPQDAAYFVDYVDGQHQKNHKRVLWVEVDGKIIGIVSVTKNEFPYHKTAYYGSRIGVNHQWNGYATAAMKLLDENVKRLFPDLIRVEARIFENNQIMPKLLKHIWLELEATLKNRIVYQWNVMNEQIFSKGIAENENNM